MGSTILGESKYKKIIFRTQLKINYMKKIITFLFSISVGSFCIAQAPVAYYPFTGNPNDASGNNHHGTGTNISLAPDRASNPNSAYSFDGTTSKIEISDTTVFNVRVGSFTLSYWFKTTAGGMCFATGMQGFKSGIFSGLGFALPGEIGFGVGAPLFITGFGNMYSVGVATKFCISPY